eukprot:CAMPEP_0197577406 /NCGR_PEP_ID=MMETSP1326-20131121/2048_1 /TAXON_ID=1155430 /ORGANISM="Genus nov. species nov., Strain RCC2288" /LENGTH=53 /DNA_ID=CAMNT_0043140471 /DNA_START=12 /DNA_END=169 /DNA_ORIENTATION=+
MSVTLDGGFAYGSRGVNVTASASSLTSVFQGVSAAAPTITIRDVDTVGFVVLP